MAELMSLESGIKDLGFEDFPGFRSSGRLAFIEVIVLGS